MLKAPTNLFCPFLKESAVSKSVFLVFVLATAFLYRTQRWRRPPSLTACVSFGWLHRPQRGVKIRSVHRSHHRSQFAQVSVGHLHRSHFRDCEIHFGLSNRVEFGVDQTCIGLLITPDLSSTVSLGARQSPEFTKVQVEFDLRQLSISLDFVLGFQGLLVLAFLKTHDDVEDAASMCFEPRHGFTLSVSDSWNGTDDRCSHERYEPNAFAMLPHFCPPHRERTKKGPRKMLPKSFTRKEYRRRDSNPHSLARTGF